MIIIIAIIAATRASPLAIPSAPPVLQDQLQASSCNGPEGSRSLWGIIRSCALTIFLCTWASIHPNIPSPDEKWPRVALRRVGLMFAALIVPEAIVAWALKQRLAAVELAEKHKGEGWTITHGFFAIMGGFTEYEGNKPIQVLYPKQLKSYSLTGNGDFPRISKAEIEDKSKGDAISKVVVILQTGWFVTQCIARGVQGLQITELEVVTLAFATLNFLIYLLWWGKPLNVQRGVRVYKKRVAEQPIDDGNVEATVGFCVALQEAFSSLPVAIARGPLMDNDAWKQSRWLVRVLFWPIMMPLYIIAYRDVQYENMTRVDTFYPRAWVRISSICGALLMIVIASAFGGIHCIGWSLNFPSSIEQTFWRAASAAIAGVPFIFSSFGFVVSMIPDRYTGPRSLCMLIGMILPLFLYILSRLALLVLPILCLRSLPPAAYRVVDWTAFIPHV